MARTSDDADGEAFARLLYTEGIVEAVARQALNRAGRTLAAPDTWLLVEAFAAELLSRTTIEGRAAVLAAFGEPPPAELFVRLPLAEY